ncbi:MAG TPA: hypothetical protein VGI39_16135 [Polyangiaceae bacterium]
MSSVAEEWIRWIAGLAPRERDAAVEERLGIAVPTPDAAPGEHLIGYHPSGVAPIVRALAAVPVRREDVLVDLGSGLGKVVLLAALLTGVRAQGVELQPELARSARAAAGRLGVPASFSTGDARTVPLDEGTVFFLYVPFVGPVLDAVLERLRHVASSRPIVVCALGVDLDHASWLTRRPLDDFWLAIYDSVTARPLVPPAFSPYLETAVEAVAFERPWERFGSPGA